MDVLLWTVISFLSGSIPYSLLIGRLAAGKDIRAYGDHNPGAANVFRAAGWHWGALAMLLDYLKAAVPVGVCRFFLHYTGWSIVPIALAPIAGHAFSPWLRGHGGKAIAATFGSWTGLTAFVSPIILGVLFTVMYSHFVVSGWAVFLGMIGFGGFIWHYYGNVHPEFIPIWVGNLALLVWKHRQELTQPPGIRPWLLRLMHKQKP